MKENGGEHNSYLCNVNDKLASIFLNLSLKKSAPLPDRPWLLWVWVYFQTPRTDGLSASEEAPVLYVIEDALDAKMEAGFGAIQAGRITTEGRREFYYYGERRDDFASSIHEVMETFPGYRFACSTQMDAAWNQYLNVLYPSGEDLQKMGNRDVLDALRRNGDDPNLVREVDHWIVFDKETVRDEFANDACVLGYREVSRRHEPGAVQPFTLVLARNQKATPDAIDESTIELFRLANQFAAMYDGWETQTTKEGNSEVQNSATFVSALLRKVRHLLRGRGL